MSAVSNFLFKAFLIASSLLTHSVRGILTEVVRSHYSRVLVVKE